MHVAYGLFWGTMGLLAFASRQSAPKIMVLSVRFSHSRFVQFFFVTERLRAAEAAGGAKRLYVFAPEQQL